MLSDSGRAVRLETSNLFQPEHIGNASSRTPIRPYYAQCMAGMVGAAVALLLGSAGFGLGCLIGLASPAPAKAILRPAPAVRMLHDTRAALAEVGTRLSRPAATPAASMQSLALVRPVGDAWVSSRYGRRADPFTGQPAFHRGIDFAAAGLSAIEAAASGVVSFSGPDGGYGNLIEIDHGNGWITRYGHNASNLVRDGDYVKPGQTIALMGQTGRATGTHLHFEVLYRNHQLDPAPLLPVTPDSAG